MPDASRSRTIAASAGDLWDVISDPHHLPRWWPRVSRVEDVEQDAFTEVLKTAKGRSCAPTSSWSRPTSSPAGHVVSAGAGHSVRTPTAVGGDGGAPGGGHRQATKVTIELRQVLNGGFPRFGGYMVIRAARATIDEALDGLERVGG